MRRLAMIVGLGAALAVPSPAFGWDYQECLDWYNETGQIHSDCEGWFTPPVDEVPPVVTLPPSETVVPEVTPPIPPVPTETLIPPPVEVPPVEETAAEEQAEEEWTPTPDDYPVKPKLGIGSAAYAESQQAEVSAAEVRDTLPLTGPSGLIGLVGVAFLAAGVLLKRRSSIT